jgi:hypothetical protein
MICIYEPSLPGGVALDEMDSWGLVEHVNRMTNIPQQVPFASGFRPPGMSLLGAAHISDEFSELTSGFYPRLSASASLPQMVHRLVFWRH